MKEKVECRIERKDIEDKEGRDGQGYDSVKCRKEEYSGQEER